jgi:hypothetical protein
MAKIGDNNDLAHRQQPGWAGKPSKLRFADFSPKPMLPPQANANTRTQQLFQGIKRRLTCEQSSPHRRQQDAKRTFHGQSHRLRNPPRQPFIDDHPTGLNFLRQQ